MVYAGVLSENTMSDFKTRLVTERDELAERYQKLTTFLAKQDHEEHAYIDPEDRRLLTSQASYMAGYLLVLQERCRRLGIE